MDLDRRAAPRTPVHVYFNKYIDGVPYLCEAIEISMSGMLVRKVHEPENALACYAVELGKPGEVAPAPPEEQPSSMPEGPPPGERVWLCASPVWSHGRFEALTFVGQSHLDRLRLADFVSTLRGPAVATRATAQEVISA